MTSAHQNTFVYCDIAFYTYCRYSWHWRGSFSVCIVVIFTTHHIFILSYSTCVDKSCSWSCFVIWLIIIWQCHLLVRSPALLTQRDGASTFILFTRIAIELLLWTNLYLSYYISQAKYTASHDRGPFMCQIVLFTWDAVYCRIIRHNNVLSSVHTSVISVSNSSTQQTARPKLEKSPKYVITFTVYTVVIFVRVITVCIAHGK